MNGQGEFAIITGALSAENQNQWISFMRQCIVQKYPGMKLIAVRPSDDDHDKAFSQTQALLRAYPEIKVIIGISAPQSRPRAKPSSKPEGEIFKLSGSRLPNLCRPYVKEGVIEAVALWSTNDLGYLAVEFRRRSPAALG